MPMNTWEWVHFHHCADANNWYWDSRAWMRVAMREDAESGRGSESLEEQRTTIDLT